MEFLSYSGCADVELNTRTGIYTGKRNSSGLELLVDNITPLEMLFARANALRSLAKPLSSEYIVRHVNPSI